eukprot:684628-Amphidinium_carterae.1
MAKVRIVPVFCSHCNKLSPPSALPVGDKPAQVILGIGTLTIGTQKDIAPQPPPKEFADHALVSSVSVSLRDWGNFGRGGVG